MVRIELFGVPRMRAAKSELEISAASLGEAIAELDRVCPELEILERGTIAPRYLIAVNGRAFTRDPVLVLEDGDVLVIVSAQAGG
jgi:molybdopterin converting factor small subunit